MPHIGPARGSGRSASCERSATICRADKLTGVSIIDSSIGRITTEGVERMRTHFVPAASWQSWVICLVTAATSCLVLLATADTCRAQFSLTSRLSEAERDRMYEEIADEVAALQRQGNILKKVIFLARPTVVHIEAKIPRDGRGRRSKGALHGRQTAMKSSARSRLHRSAGRRVKSFAEMASVNQP